jgi:hypothetical protein
MSPKAPVLALAAASLLLASCGQEKVSVYRVPREKEPVMGAADAAAPAEPAPAPTMADTAVPTAGAAALAWDAPASWKAKPASAMRKASYEVPGANGPCDLSVTAFPGDVGGELANVNRWRGQIGLPQLGESELDSAVSRVQVNGLGVTLVELGPTGAGDGKSILGAIVPVDGATWFFKLSGPGPSVKAARGDFLGFVQTVRPAAAAPEAAAPLAPMAATSVPTAGGANLVWQAPADWGVAAASAMRKASYVVGAGDLSVTAFPGDVGGELANVNRWRGQIGLPSLGAGQLEASVSRFESNGLSFAVVEMASADLSGKAILGAMVPYGGSTWFFKLTGPPADVARSKPAFMDFLRTIRAP